MGDSTPECVEEKLVNTWKSLLPPVLEEELRESWVAVVFSKSKKTHQLIFGRLKTRFLHDPDGDQPELIQWDVDCCKPYRIDSGTGIVEEIPGGEKPHTTAIYDIIYYFPSSEGNITYNKSNQWCVKYGKRCESVQSWCKNGQEGVFKEASPDMYLSE